MRPHRASTIVILGLVGLFAFAPLGIAAWQMGNKDLRLMDAGWMDARGRSHTNFGRICGIIATIIFFLQMLLIATAIILVASKRS
jgi:hypothetical protein